MFRKIRIPSCIMMYVLICIQYTTRYYFKFTLGSILLDTTLNSRWAVILAWVSRHKLISRPI